jgi:porin
MEVYYAITAAPWLHITPNFQIVDPANQFVDTALVAGVRVKIDI